MYPGCISQIVQGGVILNEHNDRAHMGDVQRCIMIIIFVSANYVIVGIQYTFCVYSKCQYGLWKLITLLPSIRFFCFTEDPAPLLHWGSSLLRRSDYFDFLGGSLDLLGNFIIPSNCKIHLFLRFPFNRFEITQSSCRIWVLRLWFSHDFWRSFLIFEIILKYIVTEKYIFSQQFPFNCFEIIPVCFCACNFNDRAHATLWLVLVDWIFLHSGII